MKAIQIIVSDGQGMTERMLAEARSGRPGTAVCAARLVSGICHERGGQAFRRTVGRMPPGPKAG